MVPDRQRVTVVVGYYRDTSRSPRAGRRDRDRVYWACIAVCCATLRHVAGPDPRFLVFAGEPPPPDVGSVLLAWGAEVRQLEFAHRPPDGFYERYVASLYLLDTMGALAGEVLEDEVVLFADPDIAWVADPSPLVEEVRRGGIVGYDLRVPDSVPMCDLTRRQQAEVIAEIVGRRLHPGEPPPTHFGGELYGMLGSELAGVTAELDALWSATLQRHAAGRAHFTVEEHLMNAVLWRRGEQYGRANPHLERIRTLPRPFGTRERAHAGLIAWHLPLEKDRGFLRLSRRLAAGRQLPPPGPVYRRWLSRRLGISASTARWVADRVRQLRWWVTRREAGSAARHGL